jgi:hypothetical protein
VKIRLLYKTLINGLTQPSINRNFLFFIVYFLVIIFASFLFLKKEEILRKESLFLQQTSEKIEKTIISEFNYGKFQINYLKKQIAKNPDYNKIKELITAINDKDLENLLTWHRVSWVNKDGFITINSTFGELGK